MSTPDDWYDHADAALERQNERAVGPNDAEPTSAIEALAAARRTEASTREPLLPSGWCRHDMIGGVDCSAWRDGENERILAALPAPWHLCDGTACCDPDDFYALMEETRP